VNNHRAAFQLMNGKEILTCGHINANGHEKPG
jgi:hypothetical protein